MFPLWGQKENTNLFLDRLKADRTEKACKSLADAASHVMNVKTAIETLS